MTDTITTLPIEPTHYLDAMGLCYTAERAKFIGIDVAAMVALYAAPQVAQPVREPVAMEDAESLLQDVAAYIGVGGFNGATPKQLAERICAEFERLNNKAQTAQPVRAPSCDTCKHYTVADQDSSEETCFVCCHYYDSKCEAKN